jgi:hypothetical protein
MKKANARKLTLHRQTLATLTPSSTQQIAGGAAPITQNGCTGPTCDCTFGCSIVVGCTVFTKPRNSCIYACPETYNCPIDF